MEMLEFSGELSVQRACELKTVLVEALSKSDEVKVSIREATTVDLSFLQLLCAAHRTALKSNKHFEVDTAEAPLFTKVQKEAGFVRNEPCEHGSGSTCLWVEQK